MARVFIIHCCPTLCAIFKEPKPNTMKHILTVLSLLLLTTAAYAQKGNGRLDKDTMLQKGNPATQPVDTTHRYRNFGREYDTTGPDNNIRHNPGIDTTREDKLPRRK